MRTYEGMFLLDPAMASDFPAAEAEVRRILDRAEAEVLGLSKWDERKLSYEIRKHKRGLYVLSYFKVKPDRITDVDRDVRLSEKILRAMVLASDEITPEEMQKALTTSPAPVRSHRDDSGRRGFDDRGPRGFDDRGPPRGFRDEGGRGRHGDGDEGRPRRPADDVPDMGEVGPDAISDQG